MMTINVNYIKVMKRSQQGAVLAVSLILLVLITLLGLSGIRTVSLEEKMAANSYDRNIAFQSAEAALREGEQYVETNKPIPTYTDADNTACPAVAVAINNCAAGICPVPDVNCASRWDSASGFTAWTNYTGSNLGALAGTVPQYFAEYIGGNFDCADGGPSDPKNCKRYRVTARSNPSADRASVMLQSIYATD